MLLLAGLAGAAHAQGKLGTYTGTVLIQGTEQGISNKNERVSYRAEVKISMPLTSGEVGGSAMAEIGDVDKPSAMATITQWDFASGNTSADSDGKFTTWSCKLVAPVTIPMNAQGVLNVDFRKKTHSLFVAAVGLKPMAMACVNSRSGAYKERRSVGLAFGTNDPGSLPYVELPVADPARLTAKHTFSPPVKGRKVVLDQEWDFRLQR